MKFKKIAAELQLKYISICRKKQIGRMKFAFYLPETEMDFTNLIVLQLFIIYRIF